MSFFPSHRPAFFFLHNRVRSIAPLIALSIIMGLFSLPCFAAEPATPDRNQDATTENNADDDSVDSDTPLNQPAIKVSAKNIYIFSTNRGAMLYNSADSEPQNIPAASKLMTAVIALEDLPEDTVITISEAVEDLDQASPTPVYIKKGTKYTVGFLVSSMLYHNSDAAALALAEYIANDESSFVERMNNKVKTLSMKNTNFITISGTSNLAGVSSDVPPPSVSRQFTTVEDLSILFRYALNLTEFREIFTDYNVLEFQDTGSPLSVSSLVISAWGIDHVSGAQFFPDNTESAANSCLLALASEENFEIGIILTNFSNSSIYADLKQTAETIYAYYEVSNLIEAGDAYRFIEIEGLSEPVPSVFKNNILYIHPIGRYYSIPESQFTPSKVLSLPIKKGDILGQVEIILEDGTKIITEVVAEDTVTVKTNFLTETQALMDTNRNISILILISFVSLLIFLARNLFLWIRRTRNKSRHI